MTEPYHTSSRQTGPVYKLDIGHVNELSYVSAVPNSSYFGDEYHQNIFLLWFQFHRAKHNSYLTNRGFSTTSAENDECKDSWAVKKWNSDINYYRNTGKASKINQSYECNIDKPSLATKEIKTLVREEP